MANGSLILFGSYKGCGRKTLKPVFCLDTVFVVAGKGQNYTDNCEIDCSDEYRNLTLRWVGKRHGYTFYRGVGYGGCDVFSFTPVKLYGDKGWRERCVIEDIEVLNPEGLTLFNRNLSQNFHATVVDGCMVRSVWRKLVKMVRRQGFALGVGFDWPKADVWPEGGRRRT